MANPKPLKVYFLPFLSQGHLIPFSQFAMLFATRGLHVTIITTPLNAHFLQNFFDHDESSGHRVVIDIHTVSFPYEEAGLPEGTENFFNVKDLETSRKMFTAIAMLRPQIESFIGLNPPDCIISDFVFTWSSEVASHLEIPRLTFNPFCTFAVCMIDAVHRHFINRDSSESLGDDHNNDPFGALSEPSSEPNDDDDHQPGDPFVVPGLPHPIFLALQPPRRFFKDVKSALDGAMKTSYGLIVNNFDDLDCDEYIDYYRKISGHKVWHIGPASLMLRNTLQQKDLLLPHQQISKEHEHIRSWLDSKKTKSVVLIGFGSICYFPDPQLFEIACAMESSGHSFIWVVRREADEEGKKAWLPEGFEERMKKENRGLILTKWAPQELILNHPATGGFLTHCGWASVTEAVSAGVPLITWPVFADQFYTEKLITQVHGFGVEVGAEEWNWSPFGTTKKVVSRVKIENGVRRLMDGGDEAEKMRRKVREMREKAHKAAEEDGSSQKNLTALIEDLKELTVSQAK